MSKFQLGEIVATPAALKAIEEAGQSPTSSSPSTPTAIGARFAKGMPPSTTNPSSMGSGCCRPTAH